MEYGYIEKDWGTSFPKSYLWCQANNFYNNSCSLFFSIADIPLKMFNFKGFICVFIFNNKEYRFTTYNNSKINKLEIINNFINIEIKKGNYLLDIKCNNLDGHNLFAPINGDMKKNVIETINSIITVILKKNNKILFCGNSINCGLEIVK